MKSSEKWRHFCKIIFQPLFYRLSASLLAYKWPTFFQSFIYSKTFIELASFLKLNLALLQKTATSDERLRLQLYISLYPQRKCTIFLESLLITKPNTICIEPQASTWNGRRAILNRQKSPFFYAKIMSKFTRRLNKSQSFNIWNQGVT